jgi:nitroreductase
MTQTPLNELARRRRSIRKFKQDFVPMEIILSVLDTAHYAPSGANEQPWRFIVVTDPELKKRIRQSSEKGKREMYAKVSGEFRDWLMEHRLNPDKQFLEGAPTLIVVLMKAKAKYAKESIWTSIGYILLALEEQGYCTVPYTPSNTFYPLSELDVPKGYRLEAILPVGLSDDDSPRTSRDNLDNLVFINRWGEKSTG